MKKTVKILFVAIIAILILLCGREVKAAVKPEFWLIDLPENLLTKEETTIEGTDEKLTNVNVTVTLTKNLIDTILSDKPGDAVNTANLGTFYFKLHCDSATNFQIKNGSDVNSVRNSFKTSTNAPDFTNQWGDGWMTFLKIQYSNDGSSWALLTGDGNGTKTIGDAIKEKLTLDDKTLEYGKNYRFIMNDSTRVFGWSYLEGGVQKYEFAKITNTLNFPVSATTASGEVYYPTLKEAVQGATLDTGISKITVNGKETVSENIDLPANVTLEVGAKGSITVKSGVIIRDSAGEKVEGAGITYKKASSSSNKNPDTKYEFTKGQNSEYTLSSGENLEFRTNGEFKYFKAVYVDGKELSKDKYEVKEGSTIITLASNYLDTLSEGKYEIKVSYTNGKEVLTDFNIKREAKDVLKGELDNSPQTGDEIYLAVGVLTLIAILNVAYFVYMKKR